MVGRTAALAVVVVHVATGCSFRGAASSVDGSLADSAGDGEPGCESILPFQPSNFSGCDLPAAGPSIVIPVGSMAILDTSAASLTLDGAPVAISAATLDQTEGGRLFVIVADLIAVDGQLRVTGSYPAAIVARATFGVTGSIHAGASATSDGPGANPAACGAAPHGVTQLASNADSGGTGGGGGGFAHTGGSGANVPTGGGAVAGGPANGNASLVPLRGGCRGGDGGFGDAIGGGGGGGLQLVAGDQIVIGGTVSAPGGGGTGSSVGGGGGGGGGSGGAVLVEATEITIDGAVTAQGGAGGEGSRRTTGFTAAGGDGHVGDAVPATCVPISASGGRGGSGGAGAMLPGDGFSGANDATDAAGGGGGGGSAGRIHLGIDAAPVIAGLVSPAP